MKLHEALEYGRKCRRRDPKSVWQSTGWLSVGPDIDMAFTLDDLTADDWEVEPVAVTITPADYWAAYLQAKTERRSAALVVARMAQHLGLGASVPPDVVQAAAAYDRHSDALSDAFYTSPGRSNDL